MTVNGFWRIVLAIVALGLLSVGTAPAQEPVSPNPHYVLKNYELTRGQGVQKFNGAFVAALRPAFAAASSRRCLKEHASAQLSVKAFSAGGIAIDPQVCAIPSATKGNVTGEVALPAARILALVLVADEFETTPFLRQYDTNLNDYDVEIYGKAYKDADAFRVSLMPVWFSKTILGCAPSTPIAVSYSVDAATFAVQVLPFVC
jgi:hypothetical protein